MCTHSELSQATSADWETVCVECGEVIVDKKPGRGGVRKGAGRKPSPTGPKGSVTLWLSADVAAFLETFGQERSATVEKTLRKTAAFKTWLKSQAAE